jgi:oxygen-independent coproporphyrinogen-3 oxidase
MPNFELIQKYNVPVPRYTSYPTVPFWENMLSDNHDWKKQIELAIQNGKSKNGISIYIHLPFCEQLCTYCGCNKRITKNHSVEEIYIEAVLKEWEMYKSIFKNVISIKEIHLGGGTPTFFSPKNLEYLVSKIIENLNLDADFEFSFEGHPNNSTFEHLKILRQIGFNRVSFGIQDLDIKVQKAINRIQPFSKTKQVTAWANELAYTSVNFDLIYGLPFQTKESIKKTIQEVITLQPDRIAFYSYAHVPWTKKSQRAYGEDDLPKGKEKHELYLIGKNLLMEAGYEDVGMDHFALKNDNLLLCKNKQTLHRNFMGYTTNNTQMLIGLGVSAISDVFFAYRQNCKTVEEYYHTIHQNLLPIEKGINLKTEDIENRNHILNIACKGKTTWTSDYVFSESEIQLLQQLEKDKLIVLKENNLELTQLGWSFLRNICTVFDKKLNASKLTNQGTPKFSQAI